MNWDLEDIVIRIKEEMGMTLRTALLKKIPAGKYVEIRENGWRIGFTYIDNEDFFIHSLNPILLEQEVLAITEINNDAFKDKIFRIDIE